MSTTYEFGTTPETKQPRQTKKTEFVNLNSTAVVRVLSNSYHTVETHYINKATVACLGEDCPVCATNKTIILQNPETFREDPRYFPKRKVCMVNVLDKTPVKTCPNCSAESGAQAQVCAKCNAILSAVQAAPSNKVKVLSRGVTLFEHLGAISNAILDGSGEKLGLTAYDITLMVAGTGKEKTITPIPGTPSAEPLLESGKDLDSYDLDKVVISLTPPEMLDLQRGVSLRDLFAARRSSDSLDSFTKSVMVDGGSYEETKQSVDKLFD